jgi:hypothetical protein
VNFGNLPRPVSHLKQHVVAIPALPDRAQREAEERMAG